MTPDDDATRAALAVMTAWAADEDSSDVLGRYLRDPDFDAIRIAIGFHNLCGLLLTMRHGELDAPPLETLRYIATRPWNLRE
jgi:hypothetical protein